MPLRLEPVTPDNVRDACALTVEPDQEAVVAPVAVSLAEAYTQPQSAWPRLVYDDQDLVGFVMAGFDPENPVDLFRCGIWRLNIAAGHQGRGYGRFAVEELCAEARRRGQRRVTVMWEVHPAGPEGFYRRIGFTPTGQIFHGEVVGERLLD
ncbi:MULTISPECIES: GNAT family N-acetyltransferase [Actinoalloteichus]|uniref:Acetyltransferase (GNAT) family protein n=1 Tax=Actinoalloteichus fjordicus TaxID=1612552 RepID=A0AAC9PSD2_9PSEU|nr:MULTISPECIES: GNAT family N-acetyltransferase [Actinoalloteichus]APU14887.1 acetyltransferase (GNAT) family protein [Actinoalloteichus fjordicus]APU20856.1 acetyltransferase (GNAT) family protein [Actinoalloteichus sp. GBA129-24]